MSWCDIRTFTELLISLLADCTLSLILLTQLALHVRYRSSRNRPEQAQGVPGSLRPRIFLTFGTTWVVGRQPFSGVESTPGHMVPSEEATEKNLQ